MHGGPRKFFHRKNKKRTQLPRTAITTGEKNSTTPIFQNHRPLKTYFSQSIPPSLQTEENAPGLPNFKPRLWQSILLRNCSSFAPPKFLCNFCIVTPFHLRIAFEFWPVGKKEKRKKKQPVELHWSGLGRVGGNTRWSLSYRVAGSLQRAPTCQPIRGVVEFPRTTFPRSLLGSALFFST